MDRAFVRTAWGLAHYRSAGNDTTRPPVLLLHGGPGSSASLLPLIAMLGKRRRVIAPDTPGCGESDPLPGAETAIIDYADALRQVLHALGIPCVDVYGHHTGAQIACELAIMAPAAVRRLVLDGVGLCPADLRKDFLERYAPPLVPADDGSHLTPVWDFVRNLTRYFPHYRQDDGHRTAGGHVSPPQSRARWWVKS